MTAVGPVVPGGPGWTITHYSAAMLFAMARDAANEVTVAPEGPNHGRTALLAIVFAALSVEAFLGEVEHLARETVEREKNELERERFRPQVTVSRFLDLASATNWDRASTELKFQLLSSAFKGVPYPRGSLPFADLMLLMSLRNSIVHVKPYSTPYKPAEEAEPPKVAQRLEARGIKIERKWLYVIGVATPEVAVWACNTAAAMMQSVFDMADNDGFIGFIGQLAMQYGPYFVPCEVQEYPATVSLPTS